MLKTSMIVGLLLSLLLCSCTYLFRASRTVFLRSKPAIVSRDEIILMIQEYGFQHPADLTYAKLAGQVVGDFEHKYEAQTEGGEDVVLDHATALMWQRSGSQEPLTWMESKTFVQELNQQEFAGFTDWRLPTIEELASLLEFTKRPGRLYLSPVFDTTQLICWSADILNSSANVWFVYFDHGYISNTDADSKLYVRAVRSK